MIGTNKNNMLLIAVAKVVNNAFHFNMRNVPSP